MSLPLISIVLPTYNGSRYLIEAIESCRLQTFPDWELIIVDDASTDETTAICSRFLEIDSRIRVVRHNENKKLPAALNTGFAQARGEFFTWTSDDNLYEPDALDRMCRFLNENRTTDIVYSDYKVVDVQGNPVRTVRAPSPDALVSCNAVGASFLYRRHVHESLAGYDESLFLVEDYDFWVRASLRFIMEPLHEPLYRYRHHDKSLTAQRQYEIAKGYYRILQKYLPVMHWLRRTSQCAGWLNLAGISWEQGEFGPAFGHACRAVRSSMLVSVLVIAKILFCGRRVTYTHQLHIHDLPFIHWLEGRPPARGNRL